MLYMKFNFLLKVVQPDFYVNASFISTYWQLSIEENALVDGPCLRFLSPDVLQDGPGKHEWSVDRIPVRIGQPFQFMSVAELFIDYHAQAQAVAWIHQIFLQLLIVDPGDNTLILIEVQLVIVIFKDLRIRFGLPGIAFLSDS